MTRTLTTMPPLDVENITVGDMDDASERVGNGTASLLDHRMVNSIVPAQSRPCGDCNMCCTAPAIEETTLSSDTQRGDFPAKPACQACEHSGAGGCGIYEKRPSVCKNYICLWAMGLIPAKHYPMKRGVAWTYQPDQQGGGIILMGHCLDVESVMRDPVTVGLISGFLKMGKFVGITIRDSRSARRFFPNGKGAMAYIDQSDPEKVRIMPHTERTFDYSFA